MPKTHEDPILTVRLEKGLADRSRLSLAHVLNLLDELRQMICEVGRNLQREEGVADPTGEFGLELIAGPTGHLLRKGSIVANIALTQNIQTGLMATQRVVQTIELINSDRLVPDVDQRGIDSRILRGLIRISRIQKFDKTEMQLKLKAPGKREAIAGRFGEAGMARVRSLQAPTFTVEDVTVYGKLIQLIDRDPSDDQIDKSFLGILRRENEDEWRLQCDPKDLARVSTMFGHQVRINGTAVYYRVASTKIIVKQIDLDQDRDFDSAFDELFGSDRELCKVGFDALLRQIQGEE